MSKFAVAVDNFTYLYTEFNQKLILPKGCPGTVQQAAPSFYVLSVQFEPDFSLDLGDLCLKNVRVKGLLGSCNQKQIYYPIPYS
jgi:hypothetical protein